MNEDCEDPKDSNPLDMMIKPLTKEKQKLCRDLVGVGVW